jgi:hypothetical protein
VILGIPVRSRRGGCQFVLLHFVPLLLDMAIAAILKSIVATQTFWLRISSNIAIALESKGKNRREINLR